MQDQSKTIDPEENKILTSSLEQNDSGDLIDRIDLEHLLSIKDDPPTSKNTNIKKKSDFFPPISIN